jgi:hypothetical protein
MVIDLAATTADAPVFVARVRNITAGVCRLTRPVGIYVVRINHWFDWKWLKFSGKSVGALGVWCRDVTIPPFHPHRVRSELLFRPTPGWTKYQLVPIPDYRLHVFQNSGRNLGRLMRREIPNVACVWYSGDSKAIGRGSIMVYAPGDKQYWAWYLDVVGKGSAWETRWVEGISRGELTLFEGEA